jgi:anti-sigma B factor antagonist
MDCYFSQSNPVASSDLDIRPLDGCTLVRAAGPRLDAAAVPFLKNAVIDLANAGQLRVVLSLAQVEQIDSSGLGALIALHKTLEPPRGRLVLCDVPAKIQPILKLTRLDRVLVQAPDGAAAAALARAA